WENGRAVGVRRHLDRGMSETGVHQLEWEPWAGRGTRHPQRGRKRPQAGRRRSRPSLRERVRSSGLEPVVTLVLKKRLLLNAPRECLLVTLSGKKPCDINKRLDPF